MKRLKANWLRIGLMLGCLAIPSLGMAKEPCGGTPLGKFADQIALALANMDLSATDRAHIRANGAEPNVYVDGWGWVRTDFYAISVDMPKGMHPQELLDMIRDDPTNLGDKRLKTYVGWPKAGPNGRKKYEVVDLDIIGPNNGGIAYTDVDTSDGEFTVVTVTNDSAGSHPVSGARRWGYSELTDGKVLFWTSAIESANVWGSGGVGAAMQDETWNALVRDIGKEVENRGGKAHTLFADDEWQNGGMKPGHVRAEDMDSTGNIDSAKSYDLLEKLDKIEYDRMTRGFVPFF
jgi:hypothetical protein